MVMIIIIIVIINNFYHNNMTLFVTDGPVVFMILPS